MSELSGATTEEPSAAALDAAWQKPQMRRLLADRRRFFATAWTVFAVGWLVFFLWPSFSPATYGHVLVPGLSVAMLVCAGYVVLCFALTFAYARAAAGWDTTAAELARSLEEPAATDTNEGEHRG